jgi:hypothetical protein
MLFIFYLYFVYFCFYFLFFIYFLFIFVSIFIVYFILFIYLYFWSNCHILAVAILIQFNLINPSNTSYQHLYTLSHYGFLLFCYSDINNVPAVLYFFFVYKYCMQLEVTVSLLMQSSSFI